MQVFVKYLLNYDSSFLFCTQIDKYENQDAIKRFDGHVLVETVFKLHLR